MADFLTELFENIFTPGAGRPLVIATNLAFGGLQLTLFALLLATWSIHCVVLSVLTAALWGAINWFIAETNRVAAQQAEEKRREEKEKGTGTGEGETIPVIVVGEEGEGSGSKGVEVVEVKGELIDRGKALGDTEPNTEGEFNSSTFLPPIHFCWDYCIFESWRPALVCGHNFAFWASLTIVIHRRMGESIGERD